MAASPSRGVGVLAALAAGLFAAMVAYTAPLTPGIPALQLSFSASAFDAVLTRWDAEGLRLFRNHFFIDFPFLLAYAVLGQRLVTRTRLFARHRPGARSALAWALPLAAAADAVENLIHLRLVFGGGPFGELPYLAAGSAASLKWLLIGGFAALAAAAWVRTRR